MSGIEVLAGISIPYQQNKEDKKWAGTIGHSWDKDSQSVIGFATEADKKIRKKVKNHGKFSYPLKPKTLASELTKHLNIELDLSFDDFVNTIQVNNGISLKTTRVKSKLVLIFLKYKKTAPNFVEELPEYHEYFLVMLLKDKAALKFDDNGSPNGTNIIDFEDVMQAATFSLDDFQESLNNEESPDVSFINGATDYFIDFLDAEDVIKNKESVNNLLTALADFGDQLKLTRTEREKCDGKVKAFIDENERKGFTTKLQDISIIMFNALKENKETGIERDSFEDYVREFNYKINDEFTVTKIDRDQLEFISFDTDVGNLKLKKSLIQDVQTGGNIVFNPHTDELTITTKVTDPEIQNQLKQIQHDLKN